MEDNKDSSHNSQGFLDEYLTCEEYYGEDGFYKFEKNDKFYFALNSGGKTFLRSQSYSTELARNNGINSIHRNSLLDERWIKTQTNDNKFYFCLKAGNKQEIARSCYYHSEEEMENDFEWVRGENSIIGIGATEINGVWVSAAKLLTTNNVENIHENLIDKLELSTDLKSESKNMQEEKQGNIEKPKIETASVEIPPTIIEKKGGCGKLWIWFLLAILILIFCLFFCKECDNKNEMTDFIKPQIGKISETKKVAKPLNDIKNSDLDSDIKENSEVFVKMQNAMANNVSFTIEQINKDFDKSNLSDISKSNLNEMVDFLKNKPEIILEIHAHTDDVGSDKNNKKVSLFKSELIKKYLIENGISETKINTIGFGERFPISSNLTDEGKAKNRRFEFKFIK